MASGPCAADLGPRQQSLYPQIIMQDGMEDWLGWHENHSSEDPYYCRPVRAAEINVDAITCPTKSTAQGRFDMTKPMVYYPPRNDLTMFTSKDCDQVFASEPCKRDAEMYSTMNDLDAWRRRRRRRTDGRTSERGRSPRRWCLATTR